MIVSPIPNLSLSQCSYFRGRYRPVRKWRKTLLKLQLLFLNFLHIRTESTWFPPLHTTIGIIGWFGCCKARVHIHVGVALLGFYKSPGFLTLVSVIQERFQVAIFPFFASSFDLTDPIRGVSCSTYRYKIDFKWLKWPLSACSTRIELSYHFSKRYLYSVFSSIFCYSVHEVPRNHSITTLQLLGNIKMFEQRWTVQPQKILPPTSISRDEEDNRPMYWPSKYV